MFENRWNVGQVEGAAVSCYSQQVSATNSNISRERSVSGKGLDDERFGQRKVWRMKKLGSGRTGRRMCRRFQL